MKIEEDLFLGKMKKVIIIGIVLCVAPMLFALTNAAPRLDPLFTPYMRSQYFSSTSYSVTAERDYMIQPMFNSTSNMIESSMCSDFNLLEADELAAQDANEQLTKAIARGARPQHWDDPSPVGDVPYVLLLVLLAGYAYWKRRSVCKD